MPRPFTKLRSLDLEEAAERVVADLQGQPEKQAKAGKAEKEEGKEEEKEEGDSSEEA